MKIIYTNEDGSVAVIHPTQEALALFPIEVIAKKDVPAGRPYKIVEDSVIPSDRTFRSAWEVDINDLTDGLGADFGAGSRNQFVGYDSETGTVSITSPDLGIDLGVDFV